MDELWRLSATEAASRIARGTLSSEALVRACLDRIAAREPAVGAWTHLDPEAALAEARALDRGPVRGPLHGVPIGVKDLIDTADMPTAYGTSIYAGHRPAWDAACVAAARAAGALVLGKTVSTELAYFQPGKTANPHDTRHTPGGSSSGSAAAVADCMVPLAFGTQTAGSMIRPAAYCGVVGVKPSFGLIARAGVKALSDSQDTIGVFARSVTDAGLMLAALTGWEALRASPAAPARVALCRTYEWEQAQPEGRDALEEAGSRLSGAGVPVIRLELPAEFAGLVQAQKDIMAREMAHAFAHERRVFGDQLSERLRELIDQGLRVSAERHAEACRLADTCRRRFAEVAAESDLILAPSAPGEAPVGLSATGDPIFNRIWTLLGAVCVHLPFARGPRGLPVGVQAVAPRGRDVTVLAHGAWAASRLRDESVSDIL